jgi:hypothetical protein
MLSSFSKQLHYTARRHAEVQQGFGAFSSGGVVIGENPINYTTNGPIDPTSGVKNVFHKDLLM